MEIEYKALADDILNFYGLVLCFQNFSFLLLPWLHYSVIIWVLYIYLWILFFILILSIVRLTIILFMIELLKKRFKFGLSLIKINYVMFFLKKTFSSCFLCLFTVIALCGVLTFSLWRRIMGFWNFLYIYIFTLYRIMIMCSALYVCYCIQLYIYCNSLAQHAVYCPL